MLIRRGWCFACGTSTKFVANHRCMKCRRVVAEGLIRLAEKMMEKVVELNS